MNVEQQSYGQTPDGTPVSLYTLATDKGMQVQITNYGGIIVSLTVPGRDGTPADVVLGFDTLDEYVDHNPFFGCLVGRYGNRIAQGRFTLDGVEYELAQNDGRNHLHGGRVGFDKRVWDGEPVEGEGYAGLKLTYTSPDGEEGYPGTLTTTVLYTVTGNNGLGIEYTAATDKATVVNLTNHSYFHLAGAGSGDILGHELLINASRFTPALESLIPTGELQDVAGTPFDFRQLTPIGARINAENEQLRRGGGYDHNWVVNGEPGITRLAARVYEPLTGRMLEVHTTEPGIQFYAGNMMPPKIEGKDGRVYVRRGGFCLETQHYPDSPNHPEFPSTVLRPGDVYHTKTTFTFSAR
ncbi:MAG TPA: aldose epimerase family protein [Anaerolineae bacterium]|nr:aldose epimerase family protein [Anaerolineae bacterium]